MDKCKGEMAQEELGGSPGEEGRVTRERWLATDSPEDQTKNK